MECIDAPVTGYSHHVGASLYHQSALLERYVANRQILIVTHPQIATHYLFSLIQTCQNAQASMVHSLLIPSGESYKTLENATLIWTALLDHGIHRDGLLIALGGGMIGDLVGFSAACYMRGIDFIQCPTTLLAQIDAAIGGKTGVNLPKGKNVIGAFHAPLAVISDITTLNTLGEREYISGLAELIKYGLILDANFFEWIEQNTQGLLSKDRQTLAYAIKKACALKISVVSQDEKEKNVRRVLNFGHTLAHALESLLDYKQMYHGEAVAIGMVVALLLSVQNNNLSRTWLERLIALLKKVGLPTCIPPGISRVAILTKMKHDKKHVNQVLQWVLLKAIGKATCETVTFEQVNEALLLSGAI